MTIFGVPTQALFGQLLIGLINGAFYALLSLGLSVIFGLLNIINFAHGAQYMMGAFVAYFALQWTGLGYWPSLLLAPVVVGLFGIVLERTMLKRLYQLDHLYGLLLTFGVALVVQGVFRNQFGSSGLPYTAPAQLTGGYNLGFMFLPTYRAWVVVFSLVVCFATWYVIERTKLGAYLRAATENPTLVQAFGINVPRMITLTYGFGVALAALAGVLAAPIYQVNPLMGADLIIVHGLHRDGLRARRDRGLHQSLLPGGLEHRDLRDHGAGAAGPPGRTLRTRDVSTLTAPGTSARPVAVEISGTTPIHQIVAFGAMVTLLVLAPFVVYPVFLMKALCFALFACAFNLLVGYVGLLSFGHAAFLGCAGYASAHAAKVWGFAPESAIVFGTLVAAALGVVIGALTIRSRGIYFANITLAFAQMIFFFSLQAKFTGGEDGIQAVPRGTMFGVLDLRQTYTMYFVVLVVFLLGFLVVYRSIHSPFGQVLKAIRENEPRATSLGYQAERYKLIAFVLSATLAGTAGATKALVFQLASLTDVHWTMSGEVVLMTLLGGMGTVFGPVVGAFLVISLEHYLAQIGSWLTIVQGTIFIVCVLTFRRGVIGELGRLLKKPL